jgi:hypothetical protein
VNKTFAIGHRKKYTKQCYVAYKVLIISGHSLAMADPDSLPFKMKIESEITKGTFWPQDGKVHPTYSASHFVESRFEILHIIFEAGDHILYWTSFLRPNWATNWTRSEPILSKKISDAFFIGIFKALTDTHFAIIKTNDKYELYKYEGNATFNEVLIKIKLKFIYN